MADKADSVIFKDEDNRHYEKSGNNAPICIEDELPFAIPNSWKWVKLPQIAISELGKTLDKEKNTGKLRQYLCSINIQWNNIVLSNIKEARFADGELERYRLLPNDLLVCEGGEVGRSAIWSHNEEMYYQNALHRIRFFGGIDPYFFIKILERYKSMHILEEYSKGVSIKHLVQSSLYSIYFPLPPLTEQKRIIERVDELFTKIDIIDNNQADIVILYDELKKRTLDLAIQGKLVPQDENDEPASELLKHIRAEKKTQLGKKYVDSYIYKGDDNRYYEHIDGKEKNETIEVPFVLPDNWVWSRIQNISESYIGLTYKPSDVVHENGYVVLRSSNIQNGTLDLSDIVRVDTSITEKLHVQKHDIIICARNGSKKLVGKSAIVDVDLPNLTFGAFMAICKTPLYRYVYIFLQSSLFFSQLAEVSGTTTINQLTQSSFNSFLIPIPPLSEQKRIVDKLHEILAKL